MLAVRVGTGVTSVQSMVLVLLPVTTSIQLQRLAPRLNNFYSLSLLFVVVQTLVTSCLYLQSCRIDPMRSVLTPRQSARLTPSKRQHQPSISSSVGSRRSSVSCRADADVDLQQAKQATTKQLMQGRRQLLHYAAGLFVTSQTQPWAAQAAGLTLEDVTPSIAAAGPLDPRESALISVFDRSTPAVVTVFDTTVLVSLSVPACYSPGLTQAGTGCHSLFDAPLGVSACRAEGLAGTWLGLCL